MRMLRSERGAAAVEFALVLPVLIVLVLGIVEFGRAFQVQSTLAAAAREGVRIVAHSGRPRGRHGRRPVSQQLAEPRAHWRDLTISGCAGGAANATLDHHLPAALPDRLLRSGIDLTARGVMRCNGSTCGTASGTSAAHPRSSLALLIVPLLGFAAIAVDVGAIYAERQQLQNGADAAALAIAYDCASGLPACGTSQGTAEAMTEANYDETNSSRGTPTVELGSSQVTVRNAGVQNHWFAPILGEDSTEVSARATAAWGAPGSGAAVLPLAFSWCEFEKQTGGGLPSSTTPRTIYFTKTSPAVAGTPSAPAPRT